MTSFEEVKQSEFLYKYYRNFNNVFKEDLKLSLNNNEIQGYKQFEDMFQFSV